MNFYNVNRAGITQFSKQIRRLLGLDIHQYAAQIENYVFNSS
jgi:hypothetical protein